MASEEEVLQQTGYPRGAVAPFGLPSPMRILLDEGIFAEEEISLGSGVRNTAVILRTADLRRALPEAEVGCFVEC
jgi:prolyl-tRNA editing enzyme YbaK/EbsC (Cys-tRNA(Pro) deacylase)